MLVPYFGCASPLDVSKGGSCFTFIVEKMVFCSKLLETMVNIFEWTSFLLSSSREMWGLGRSWATQAWAFWDVRAHSRKDLDLMVSSLEKGKELEKAAGEAH